MVMSFNDTVTAFKNTGDKSYSLAKASELGLNVPRYVCITPHDCINDSINPETFKRLKRILQRNFPEGTTFAVRPSINVSDKNLSKLFESYVNVPLNRLDEYIDDCLALIGTNAVQSYVKRHTNVKNLHVNVIVQEMVSQKLCGVMFTSNPLGIISENMVVAGFGDCNEILEYKNELNTYYYNTSDGQAYWVINDDKCLLSGDVLRNIYSILEKVKKFYPRPVRLDFAVDNGIVYVLQMEEMYGFSLDNIVTLCSADMVTCYEGGNLPLNQSFIKSCYSTMFSNLILRLTNSKDIIVNNKSAFDDVITIYNGRVYYNVNSLYEIFSMIPSSNEVKNVLKDDFSPINKFVDTLNMVKVILTSAHKMEDTQSTLRLADEVFDSCYSESLSNIQLRTLYRVILSNTVEKWDMNIVNSVYSCLNEIVFKKKGKGDSIQNERGVLAIGTEGGVTGVVQEQILWSLSGKSIPLDSCMNFYGHIQTIFLDMGTNLVRLDCIENPKDVYYLTVDELFNENVHSYKDVVSQRKLNYDFYSKLPRYSQISFDGVVISKSAITYGTVV